MLDFKNHEQRVQSQLGSGDAPFLLVVGPRENKANLNQLSKCCIIFQPPLSQRSEALKVVRSN